MLVGRGPTIAPDDIVLGHKEYVMLQNPHSGDFELSRHK